MMRTDRGLLSFLHNRPCCSFFNAAHPFGSLRPYVMAATHAPPRVVGAPEPFDPAKHPNCRLTELFAQGGFARVTLDQVDRIFDAAGHSRGPERAALVEAFLRDADVALDASGGRIRYLGLKPEAANGPVGDVFFVDIPGDRLSIRFFPGDSRPEDGMFFFDLYDRGRGLACNAPRGYKLEILALEAPEGSEKFAVVELSTCSLARPGRRSFHFDVPRRTRYRPLVVQPVRDLYM
ncbi:hypothetical protein B0H14DRAFT_2865529 [Mycena olivaceomarginata]|nr:hypothetical protein B0H14DRAFT_2865529 [Mycena olivaceomarginata]